MPPFKQLLLLTGAQVVVIETVVPVLVPLTLVDEAALVELETLVMVVEEEHLPHKLGQ